MTPTVDINEWEPPLLNAHKCTKLNRTAAWKKSTRLKTMKLQRYRDVGKNIQNKNKL